MLPYTRPKLIILLTVLTGVILLLLGTLTQPNTQTLKDAQYGAQTQTPTPNAILSKCGDLWYFNPPTEWYGTIPETYPGPIPTAPMIIPVYGYMNPEPFNPNLSTTPDWQPGDKRENPYTWEQTLRALWEGYTIIWAASTLPDEAYQYIQEYTATQPRTILLPYTYQNVDPAYAKLVNNGQPFLPENRLLAFSVWGASQSCNAFSEITLTDFTNNTNNTNTLLPTRDRNNPPAAPLNSNGNLNPITP